MAVVYGVVVGLDDIKRAVNVQAYALLLHVLFDLAAKLDDLGGVLLYSFRRGSAVNDRYTLTDEAGGLCANFLPRASDRPGHPGTPA